MSEELAYKTNKQIGLDNEEKASPDAVVDINMLVPESHPPKQFNESDLTELADSIKTHGMLFPVLVVNRGNHYGIVAGERRWHAAKMADLKEVPVIIREYDAEELERLSKDCDN